MNVYELTVLSVALSCDAFAVSICKGLAMQSLNFMHVLIISTLFGLFQAVMPMIGWVIGSGFEKYIIGIDHWISFTLLSFLGIKMIREAKKSNVFPQKEYMINLNEILSLSVATSIDALAAGITFACLNINIIPAVALIGSVTFILCFIGVIIGNKAGTKHKSTAEKAGGVTLILIGIKILAGHLGIYF